MRHQEKLLFPGAQLCSGEKRHLWSRCVHGEEGSSREDGEQNLWTVPQKWYLQ